MNKVDLLFIVDITGSMGGLIREAQQRMKSILETLSTKYKIDLQTGLSLYRDHPSQGDSFVTVTLNLTSTEKIQKAIDKITVGGGGDTPEAVLDGIIDGIKSMKWRDGSRRIAFLIGDAPAHGMIDGETCCQCGKTWGDAVAIAETKKVTVYSVVLSNYQQTKENFKMISNFTGGIAIESEDAMNVILSTLDKEFDDLNLDSKVLEMLSKDKTPEEICKMLNIDREKLSSSEARITQLV
jgi:hypothetical protein